MIKKTVVEGRAMTHAFTSPLAFLHDFFETRPLEVKSIIFGTSEYRTSVKKRVEAGRASKWGAVTRSSEKAAIRLKTLKTAHRRTAW